MTSTLRPHPSSFAQLSFVSVAFEPLSVAVAAMLHEYEESLPSARRGTRVRVSGLARPAAVLVACAGEMMAY